MGSELRSVPVSVILQDTEVDGNAPKKSREDWRKAKELEDARKAGTVPAAVDEEGRDINPHIPHYISSAPWYYNTTGPTLKHQRQQEDRRSSPAGLQECYKRGVDAAKTVTRYRKGACENCGAMTHKRIDCLERPRKVGAKYTGANIARNEFIPEKLERNYAEKRDRWSGYDPASHQEIVREYEKIEQMKRELRTQQAKENPDLDLASDDDKYVDEVSMPGTKLDSKQRITVRNLRIREDTAKYLRNLDLHSAYYDPKTRSMRDNPTPHLNPDETDFVGENFVRFSGGNRRYTQGQLFAWAALDKGVDVHMVADPTKVELLQREYERKKLQFKDSNRLKTLDVYGGAEHLDVPSKALLLSQTEAYVEYSRCGKIIKGRDNQIVRSCYEEDVHVNNHTAVWGSHWHQGVWGYKCCKTTVKRSYCNGVTGKSQSEQESIADCDSSSTTTGCDSIDAEAERNQKKSKKRNKDLHIALNLEGQHKQRTEALPMMDERKRPYNRMYETKPPTEEELERYLMMKQRDEDPMAAFLK